jgi:hypothetical protein
MSRRLVALLVLVAMFATACIPQGQQTYGSPPHDWSSEDRSDHDLAIGLGLGAAGLGLIIALLVMANRDHVAASAAEPIVLSPAEAEQLRLQRMYARGEALARIGRCDGVISIGRVLAQNDPAYYAQYAANPTIAACLR